MTSTPQSTNLTHPHYCISIVGGSCSGKTTFMLSVARSTPDAIKIVFCNERDKAFWKEQGIQNVIPGPFSIETSKTLMKLRELYSGTTPVLVLIDDIDFTEESNENYWLWVSLFVNSRVHNMNIIVSCKKTKFIFPDIRKNLTHIAFTTSAQNDDIATLYLEEHSNQINAWNKFITEKPANNILLLPRYRNYAATIKVKI